MLLTGAGGATGDIVRRIPSGFAATCLHRDADVAVAGLEQVGPGAGRRRAAPRPLPPGPSGTVTLLAGELFNGPALAATLGVDPSMPASLLADAVLERWGTEGLARLDGDYALVRWHPAERSLLLAACPMGRGSLYHAETPDGILAAGRPSWLLAFPEVDTEPDLDTLALRLAKMERRIADRTPWRRIRQLPPGECLEWRDGAIRVAPFWSPVPRRTLRLSRDDDDVDAAREHLDRAVAARCPSGAPILALLSAGLDSPGIVATAARRHDGPLHTLTLRPDPTVPLLEPDRWHFSDEWERVRPFLAGLPGVTAHVADAVLPDLAREAPGGPLQSRDFPIKGLHQAAHFLDAVARKADELGVGTVLVGDAGNVTLSYTGRFVVSDQLAAGRLPAALGNLVPASERWVDRLRALWGQGLSPMAGPGGRRLMRRLRGRPDHWWREWSSLRTEVAERLRLGEHDEAPVRTGSADLDAHLEGLDRHRRNIARHAFLLQDPRRVWRDPYGDLALVEFCLSLPREQFRRGGVTRRLARRTLADRVPRSILDERRVGLQHADWFGWMSLRRDWMAAEIDRIERSPLACSILDTARMRAILDAWPATPAEAGRFPTSHRLRKGLGEALRIGQFILMQEGRND